jgi:hypothetical protein
MAAAAGTALFRSMATKMAPALHRAIGARGLHAGTSSGVGRSSPNPSRLSTSSGSSATSNEVCSSNRRSRRLVYSISFVTLLHMCSFTFLQHLAARDHKVLRQVRDHL